MDTGYMGPTPTSQQDLGLRRCAAVIADLDGTLADTLGGFDVALNAMWRDLSLVCVERHAIEQMVGRGCEHLIGAVLQRVGAAESLYDHAWCSCQRRYFAIKKQHVAAYPGAIEVRLHRLA